MAIQKIELGSEGIKRVLKKYKPEEAIAEYVWNGYDATATSVSIRILQNSIYGVEKISISDNGYGIPYGQLNTKFKPFFESNKIIIRNSESNSSSYHGKNGVGRLTFFTFAGKALWETVYKEDGKKYKYSIKIERDGLNDYTATEPKEVDSNIELGTEVIFSQINEDFQVGVMKYFLNIEFCWFLELMRKNNFKLLINNEPIDYSEILEERDVRDYKYNNLQFNVIFCRWSQKLNGEYSKYYYLDSSNKEKFKENTTLNNKGDNFYHSVYVTSTLFDDFDFTVVTGQMRLKIAGSNREDEAFKYIKREIDNLIREKRTPFIKKYAKKFLKTVEEKEAYPDFDENSPVDNFKKECLDALISTVYYVEPQILSGLNKTQLKTIIRMFALIMESGEKDSFVKIIDSVVNMSKDERVELAEALEYTTMSNISRTIIMLKDRAQAVADLKELVFNKDLGAGEINAIQPFIEKHYWLFGEQYHLVTAEEPDFEEALRRYIYILDGDTYTKKDIIINDPDKRKQMDIFAVRQMKNGDVKSSIIVELKHPKVTLGYKELEQVKRYKDVILQEPRFNAPSIEWKFYLVGNKYNNQIENEIRNLKHNGERSLVYSVDNFKIYVKTWSEIFTEFELNYDFLFDKLQIEQKKIIDSRGKTKEEIVAAQENNSARAEEELTV
ncbi:ATP-binding protein [Clostridium transplantifaecale]|uniref:ATP-binding protein n=1 Tax=Clostridium transplantifaecale TaxID=2479838 RepID=UPI0013DE2411|nr:ATP-binding protein [Clostridium transplantifaecale]